MAFEKCFLRTCQRNLCFKILYYIHGNTYADYPEDIVCQTSSDDDVQIIVRLLFSSQISLGARCCKVTLLLQQSPKQITN
jgi:hypothetical protein